MADKNNFTKISYENKQWMIFQQKYWDFNDFWIELNKRSVFQPENCKGKDT